MNLTHQVDYFGRWRRPALIGLSLLVSSLSSSSPTLVLEQQQPQSHQHQQQQQAAHASSSSAKSRDGAHLPPHDIIIIVECFARNSGC